MKEEGKNSTDRAKCSDHSRDSFLHSLLTLNPQP